MGGRECAHCSTPLPVNAPHDRRYCSQKCKSKFAYDKARGPLPDKNCLWCGALMPSAALTKKYCSPNCAQRYFQAGRRADRPPVVCVTCAKELPGALPYKKFCSLECKAEDRKRKAAEERANRPLSACPGCGTEFRQPERSAEHRKFCSYPCREKFYRRKYADKRAVRNKRWRAENAETLAQKKKAYREANLEKHKEWDRARYARDRELMIAQAKANYEKNKDRIKARISGYLERKRQDPAWVAKERERARQKWHKASPEQKEAWRRRGQRRQSRKNLQRVGTVSAADWDAILRIWDHSCAYCGRRLEVNEHGNLIVDIDHIVPISRGGPHSVGNLLPTCEPCNQRKSWKLLVEWRYSARGMKRLAKGPLAPVSGKLPLP